MNRDKLSQQSVMHGVQSNMTFDKLQVSFCPQTHNLGNEMSTEKNFICKIRTCVSKY